MRYVTFALFILLHASCSKGLTEKKISSQYELADNLNAFAGILNNDDLMGESPVIGEQSCDDHYLTDNFYNKLLSTDQNLYLWKKDIFGGKTGIPDWDLPYKQVFACNLVLDGLKKIKPGTLYQEQWNETKGSALFIRSYAFFNLLQVFARAYDSSYANQKNMGIAMPLTASTELVPARATINESYRQIISDLEEALPLVSKTILPSTRNTPNKPAVFALLARVYLSMRNYSLALVNADSSLHFRKQLINYYTLNLTTKYPIAATNEETLYQSWLISTNNVIQGKIMSGTIIDSLLYSYYDTNDLRSKVYFTKGPNGPIFNNSYSGKSFAFSGLASDENYLIRAECNARLGNLDSAMADINWLLLHRYKSGTAPEYHITSQKEAIELILRERRKELIFRGLRWPDIKRLNKEEAGIKIVPVRFLNGKYYPPLLPLSKNYVLPLPDDALRENIIMQNERDERE
jgi:starch-binding outer membrane protein, SusD/RagB family